MKELVPAEKESGLSNNKRQVDGIFDEAEGQEYKGVKCDEIQVDG